MIDKDEYWRPRPSRRAVCPCRRPVSRRGSAAHDPHQPPGVHHRLQRGGDAGWAGPEMALWQVGLEGGAQSGDGSERPGGGRSSAAISTSNPATCRWSGAATSSPPEQCSPPSTRTPSAWWRSGTTYTGELEPIAEICAALDKLAAGGGCGRPGTRRRGQWGFVAPFLHPTWYGFSAALRCRSTSAATSMAALTYPGVGFYVARARAPAGGSGFPGQLPRRRHADLHPGTSPVPVTRWWASTTTSCGWATAIPR